MIGAGAEILFDACRSGSVDAAEGKMWVTPFVPGKTGTAEPKAKH